MASQYMDRMEPLNRENYETWRIHMESVLVMHDLWEYVSGEKVKPEENASTRETIALWEREDRKVKGKILLAIKPSELKHVAECITSQEVWLRLKTIFQSSGPARKATMLKKLMRCRMSDDEDVREHIASFFHTTDKLREMDVNIPRDLLALILMNSLPRSFENFRCAMESRDVLPDLETLRVKIIEEFEARKDGVSDVTSKAMIAKKCNVKRRGVNRKSDDSSKDGDKTKRDRAKLKCYRCDKIGHFAKDCKVQKKEKVAAEADLAEHTSLCTSFDALSAGNGSITKAWCLDSGCTTHMSNGEGDFQEAQDSYRGNVNLADKKTSMPVRGKGHIRVIANVEGRAKQFKVENVLRVPELRTNSL